MKPTTWIEINQSHLENNLAQYKSWLGNKTGIAPVIKGNAYGHGLYEIASICDNNNYVTRLCVVNSQEALQLRHQGIKKPILVLGYINSDLEKIVQNKIDISVYDKYTINQLQQTAFKYNQKINVHLKIDTGLSRLGIFPEEITIYTNYINSLPNIHLQGIWSHFSNDTEIMHIHRQEEILQSITNKNLEIHIAKSQASLLTKYHYNFARIGSGIYGYLAHGTKEQQIALKPVLSLKTTILHIKKISTGSHVGYQQCFTATSPTTIAILGIGYFDGLNAQLIHGGKVIIHGQYAPIISINMNFTTIDISHVSQCAIHDTVTLLGQHQDKQITAYDWYNLLHGNIREYFTKLEKSIPRIITHKSAHKENNTSIIKTLFLLLCFLGYKPYILTMQNSSLTQSTIKNCQDYDTTNLDTCPMSFIETRKLMLTILNLRENASFEFISYQYNQKKPLLNGHKAKYYEEAYTFLYATDYVLQIPPTVSWQNIENIYEEKQILAIDSPDSNSQNDIHMAYNVLQKYR